MPPGRAAGDPGRRARGHPLPVQAPATWTSSGSPAARRSSRWPTPPASRASASGPGNAPIYIHRTADLRGAVVDILISKTFDASVICPAEQTCIVDDEVYDEMVAEFQRMGAHLLTDEQVDALVALRLRLRATRSTWRRSGQQAPELARRAGFSVAAGDQDPARAAARRPRRARRAPAACRRS